MKTKKQLLWGALAAVCVMIALPACAQITESPWPDLNAQCRPWVRWWWMGSAVDKDNLETILEDFADKGIGGVEIAPIYGAKGYEDDYIPFLSSKWMDALEFTCREAGRLGMGVDMTTGTGWPFGGPQIDIDNAAASYVIQKYSLDKGDKLSDPLSCTARDQKDATLETLTAYGPNGEIVNIADHVDRNGELNWAPSSDGWTLYALFNGRTMQKVKRAAPGGEGYVFDHFSEKALKSYLKRFDDAFKDRQYGIRCFFNDSYEVYHANWSTAFFAAFETYRGYDLRAHLRELYGEGDPAAVKQVKSDYRETMSDMLLDNFTRNWTAWAHGKGSLTRNQAHGSPANLLDLYAAVDIPEIEIFGAGEFDIPGFRREKGDVKYADTDPLFQKFSSSGAHVAGHNLVSCETFTWLREHFKAGLSHCKPELDQIFLSGINHVFFHGATYSPEEAAWPGWLFYASVNFSRSNSFWPHISGMNQYIARCQSVLQAGTHANDILVYWPIYDLWADAKGDMRQFAVHKADSWLHLESVRNLMDLGYSFDLISDRQIAGTRLMNGGLQTTPNSKSYRVLAIPQCKLMPLETMENLIKLAGSGGHIVMEAWPEDVPGYLNHDERKQKLAAMIAALDVEEHDDGISICNIGTGSIIIAPGIERGLNELAVRREALTDTGLQAIRRHAENGDYYFVANLTGQVVEGEIPFNAVGTRVLMMDPLNGKYGLARSRHNSSGAMVYMSLQPGESRIVLITQGFSACTEKWPYLKPDEENAIELSGPWTLSFLEGGPELPKMIRMDEPKYWTDLHNSPMDRFSGTAVYRTAFTLNGSLADEYVLKLHSLRESARVLVNGEEAGMVWGLPFELEIGPYLKPGRNTLAIEVANLMANRVSDMARKGESLQPYHEINVVNIGYKRFDASDWKVQPSGLQAPVYLVPCRTKNQ